MFNEILELITEFIKPVLDLPSFVDENKKPLDLITLMASLYRTSDNVDRYVKIIESKDKDLVYILYRGLKEDHNKFIVYDNLLYRSRICQITMVDYDVAVNEGTTEESLLLLMILASNAVTFLKAKNSALFYHKSSSRLQFIFSEAPIFIFIELATRTFSDTPELRESMVDVVKKFGSKNNPRLLEFDIDELNASMKLLNKNGVSFLLDTSIISVAISC